MLESVSQILQSLLNSTPRDSISIPARFVVLPPFLPQWADHNLLLQLLHKPDNGQVFNTFCRLDRGKELVDHHCFFFFEGPKYHVHHSSFETHDFDTQVLGHDWLRHKGYENCWGVGRHIMGSQIFDYWFDPSRFILEHYVDGDLVDISHPTQKSAASHDGIHVWGKSYS